ncbi:MAG: hypothetical protein LBV16_02485 [Elusimicrobiota bacterium]|jgi:uncharacterized protein YcbK (DUF882 family)|nr:hypothetical protein [Elusimicrobiota bacterium]
MQKTKLNAHFTLQELTITSYVNLLTQNTKEADRFIVSLKDLCKKILEPIRVFYGKPMIITSGFRGEALNKAVGGSITSQHCRGEAADFIIPSINNMQVMKDIYSKKK